MNTSAHIANRILILTPTGDNASHAVDVLEQAGLDGAICGDCPEIERKLAKGAGALLIAEEALTPGAITCFLETLAAQPPWSDVPLLLITSAAESDAAGQTLLNTFAPHANMTLIERPLRPIALVSALRAALRARRRQYQLRGVLEEQQKAVAGLREHERRFRAVFNQQFQFMALLAPDGTVLEINELPLHATGIPREQVLGKIFWETPFWSHSAEMRENWPKRLAQAAKSSGAILSVDTFTTAGGAVRVADAAVTAVKNGAGEVELFIIQATDITDRKRAEDLLRDSEAQFVAATTAGAVGTWTWELASNVLAGNPALARTFGLDVDEVRRGLPAEAYMSAIFPEDQPAVEQAIARALAPDSDGIYEAEYRTRDTDGNVHWLFSRGQVEYDNARKPVGMPGALTDITARKESEAALREALASEAAARQEADAARAHFRSLFESAPGLYLVLEADTFAIVGASEAYLRATMTERAQLFGKTIFEAFPDDPAEPHADGVRNLRASLERVRQRRVADVMAVQRYPIRRPEKEGGGFEERYWSPINSPILDPSARLEFIIHRIEDVTEYVRLKQQEGAWKDGRSLATRPEQMEAEIVVRSAELKRAEDALRESRERFDIVRDAAQVGFWFCDLPFGELIWDNRVKEHFWLSPDDRVTIGTFYEQIHPEDRERTRAAIEKSIAAQTRYDIEYRTVSEADGQEKWIRAIGRTFYGANGQPIRFDGVTLDITERKRDEEALRAAKEEAEAASRAKDHFLAQLSHELRTPLTPVLMTAIALRDDETLPAVAREQLAMVARNVALEARLIDDLLDLTRITRGMLALRAEPCDVHSLLGNVVEIVREETREKQIDLALDLRAERHQLTGDPARLQQVFWNLLRNAVKFTPAGGHIRLRSDNRASTDGTGLEARFCVEVSDDGIGFDPAAAGRLFRPFEQESAHNLGGLGLGLAIAHAIVELHGGVIRAESAGRGHGAIFTVELPGAVAVETLPMPVGRNPANFSTGAPMRLLLVEDHVATSEVLSRLLRKAGHEVTVAGSVAEARAAAAQARFDALISDLGLPDGTGNELMAHLRDVHGLSGIALSGYGMDEDLRRSRESGFSAHLVKPVDVADLQRALRRVAAETNVARPG